MRRFPYPFTLQGQSFPEDGYISGLTSFCREKKERCKAFYLSQGKQIGYSQCPQGFTVYTDNICGQIVHFTCIKVIGEFDRNKTKHRTTAEYIPTIPKVDFERSINEIKEIFAEYSTAKEAIDFGKQSFHEIRKILRDLRGASELISISLDGCSLSKAKDIEISNSAIYDLVSLMIKRMDFFDIQANPELVFNSRREAIEPYKKFDKTAKCIRSHCKQRHININLNGACFITINGYEVFDILPYLLIENAVKYTADCKDINIEFNFTRQDQYIKISNYGPQLDPDEIDLIFNKEYRGRRVKTQQSGSGTGLYFAKKICAMHGIIITASSSSQSTYNLQNVPHSLFTIMLDFSNTS